LSLPFVLVAAFVAAFDIAVAFDGADSEFDGDFYLDALGDNNVKVSAAGLTFALNIRLAAAFGFNSANVGFGAYFNGDADVGVLIANVFAVVFAANVLFVIVASGVGVHHFKALLCISLYSILCRRSVY
jgi:hypothetical protein